jgi:hypothetical protein
MLLLLSQAALAQFSQDGNKLVGMLATGNSQQGHSVAISADGATAIVGGPDDNSSAGAAWVFTVSGGVWTQQSGKLVGTGAVGNAGQGYAVALSADGDTAVVGGPYDNSEAGAAWVYTRSGGVWSQVGEKLVGSGAVGSADQGGSVALSADGAAAIVGGFADNSYAGAAWIFTLSGGVWSQQGDKLVGSGAVGGASQGYSVALSADGNTAIVGGEDDDSYAGAAWVYTLSGGVWTQQGEKLVGTDAVGAAHQGGSVALSATGATAVVGGSDDDSGVGAAWVFIRRGAVWKHQGEKLVGSGAAGTADQGWSVALSADGDSAVVGGPFDNSGAGATWVFTRSGAAWKQQGDKLVGSGAVGGAGQGWSVAMSGDGSAAVVGGQYDNSNAGAAWVFVQPLAVSPYTDIAASGTKGGPFSPPSSSFTLSATSGSVKYSIADVPSWLTASSKSGTATTAGATVTFTVNASADKLKSGAYSGTIEIKNNDKDSPQPIITRTATLTVTP